MTAHAANRLVILSESAARGSEGLSLARPLAVLSEAAWGPTKWAKRSEGLLVRFGDSIESQTNARIGHHERIPIHSFCGRSFLAASLAQAATVTGTVTDKTTGKPAPATPSSSSTCRPA